MTYKSFGLSVTRRHILQGAATMAVASLIGCEKNSETTGIVIPSDAQPAPTGALSMQTLTVSTPVTGSIPAGYLGLSFSKNMMQEKYFNVANTNLVGLMQRLGPGVLRIGAIPVEWQVYNSTGAGNTPGQIAPIDIDNLSAFIKATGWQCLYAINLEGYAPSGITVTKPVVATTPALAAAEVAYAVQSFGSSLLGIEIGNEPDNYPWTFAQFKVQWEAMRSAIVAVSPSVNITGPGNGHDVPNETVPFAQFATKSQLSAITQHYYIDCGCNGTTTVQNLVAYPNTDLTGNYLSLLQAASTSLGIPYRITETNTYYSDIGTPGLVDTYAGALWVIDMLYTCAQYGCSGVNVFGGGDGVTYTPIADNNAGTVIGPRPEYYGMEMFALAGQGTMITTALSTGRLNVSAYAIQTATGGLNIVINNKEVTNLQMAITLPQTIKTATLLQMTQLTAGQSAPSLSAVPANETSGDQSAGTTIQGSEILLTGAFSSSPAYTPYLLTPSGKQVTCYVPALGAVLIRTT